MNERRPPLPSPSATVTADAAGPAEAPGSLAWLAGIMRRLLAPDGCPWDRKQTLQTLKPYLIEEAHEVLDAIEEGDPAHHREELGDVLFQIVFQAEVAKHRLSDIVREVGQKLIRRHPHVFGDAEVADADEVVVNWERIKQQERGKRRRGLLAGIPRSAPALHRAHRLTSKAAKVGFDWPEAAGARDKLSEELGELERAVAGGREAEVLHEAGDVLFAAVNWLRKLGVEPEDALRRANRRFEGRFAHIEARLAEAGTPLEEATLEQMDRLWNEAKQLQNGRMNE